MFVFDLIRRVLVTHFVSLSWRGLLLVVVSYMVLTWVMLYLCGEKTLLSPVNYYYWLIVTASTVGYGDLSPVTRQGKLVVSIFVIPFGLAIFALLIGRLAVLGSYHWKKGVKGLKALNLTGHIIVIGWNELRTLHLLRLLIKETKEASGRKIVLCTKMAIENPMPNEIGFVHVENFKDDKEMDRACIDRASCIIIDTESDDTTMTAALYCYGRNPGAHTIAYFSDNSLRDLLKQHCPTVECTPSVHIEMLAKSAMDPGSSELHRELLTATEGMTQYSLVYPKTCGPMDVDHVFEFMKRKYNATLIGVKEHDAQLIRLNPPLGLVINPGATIYYISIKRIPVIDWKAINA